MKYSVYILYSPKIDKFYIGYTGNISNRLAYHNDVLRNKIWTKRGIPWELYFHMNDLGRSQAMKIEKHLKKMKSRSFFEDISKRKDLALELRERFG